MQVAFKQAGLPTQARLRTRFGRIDLWAGQLCQSTVGDDGLHTLNIVKYAYYLTSPGAHEPTLRWEYDGLTTDPDAQWCRHHLQGPVELPLAGGRRPRLNDFHLPTGWVPIGEVLRFCIVDLGVRPLSPDWEALGEAGQLFSEQPSP